MARTTSSVIAEIARKNPSQPHQAERQQEATPSDPRPSSTPAQDSHPSVDEDDELSLEENDDLEEEGFESEEERENRLEVRPQLLEVQQKHVQ